MSKDITLGILETGRPPEDLRDRFPNYPDMIAQLIGGDSPKHWRWEHYPVLEGGLPSSPFDCDAWLITGSRFGVYEEHSWIPPLEAFLRDAYRARVPIVGICFGHQILAQALGGKVEKSSKGWGLGNHSYQWTQEKPDWIASEDFANEAAFSIQAFHQDQVTALPPGARVLASSDFCPYAALAYGDQALTFQGHPEFAADYMAALIELRREVLLGKQVSDEAMATVKDGNDRNAIGKSIVAFLKKHQQSQTQHNSATE